jgi:hypothetical protein
VKTASQRQDQRDAVLIFTHSAHNPVMSDEARLAYSFALELAKQLITLSSGLLVLTVAITKDLVKAPPTRAAVWVMGSAWGCFFLSILCGTGHIMGLTSSLEYASLTQAATDTATFGQQTRRLATGVLNVGANRMEAARHGLMIGPSAKGAATMQIGAFLAGVLLTAIYGWLCLRRLHPSVAPQSASPPPAESQEEIARVEKPATA